MSSRKQHIIEIDDLSIGYHKGKHPKHVLEHINVNLEKGEMVCLLGQNGIGKSTLIRTIAGIQPYLSGNILINHRSLSEFSAPELARTISLVLTDRIFTGNLTVTELITLGRHPYTNWIGSLGSEDIAKISWATEICGCSEIKDHLIGELSDGQMQKALIGRALAQDTDIIILDEPTAHLDLVNKISVLNLLKELSNKTGKSILIATHELDFSFQIADKTWIALNKDRLVSGMPEDLILNHTIDQLISHKALDFDMTNGRFSVKYKPDHYCNLKGDQSAVFWTTNALRRNYWEITQNQSPVKIEVKSGKNEYIWKIKIENDHLTADSVEELIGILRTEIR